MPSWRSMTYRTECEKMGRRGVVFLSRERRTTSATFLRSISAKLPTNTCPCGSSQHMVSHSRKVCIKRSNLPKTVFLGYLGYPVCAQPTGHRKYVLRRIHCPLLYIPQIYPSYVTFAEGCTVFQPSTSESLPLPLYQQWRYLDAYNFLNITP